MQQLRTKPVNRLAKEIYDREFPELQLLKTLKVKRTMSVCNTQPIEQISVTKPNLVKGDDDISKKTQFDEYSLMPQSSGVSLQLVSYGFLYNGFYF